MTRAGLAACALALLAGGLAGCSDPPAELGGSGTSGASGPAADRSPDAAARKLRLALVDPCYDDVDPRSVWPRCGRWVEETASTARTAAEALPSDGAVTGAAGAVATARDEFVARGCPATGPTAPPDTGACVGALITSRAAAARLAQALGVPS